MSKGKVVLRRAEKKMPRNIQIQLTEIQLLAWLTLLILISALRFPKGSQQFPNHNNIHNTSEKVKV